jgi:four helix bundle protein
VSKSIICGRAFEFSRRVVRLCDRMATLGPSGRHIATELTRAATSIGANAEEAQDAQSRRDFIAKMCIARKEAREALYWLRLAKAMQSGGQQDFDWEINEAGELRAMIVAAVRTAQSHTSRGNPSTPRRLP